MKTSNKQQALTKLKRGGVVLLGCGILFAGTVGVSAYFSDYEESVNTFTVGKISIEHREDMWDELPDEEKRDVAPNQEIAKDPKVENTGNNEAFIFQTVEIPCREVITANEDGTRNEASLTDLFSYVINNGWTLLKSENVTKDGEVTAHRYSYVYGSLESCASLKPGNTTPTLFDSVTVANIIEDQGVEATALDIVIDAYGIQTTNLGTSDTTSPLQVFEIILNQAS